jgi:FHS family L-fucose permease-like MFS transporter
MKHIELYLSKNRKLILTVILSSMFFMWGLLTNLNFFLYKHLTEVFHLSYSVSTLINLTFFFSYLVVSIQAGNVIEWLGYKAGILIGWGMASLGALIIYFSIAHASYYLFLMAVFMLASGITFLQVGANLYVVLLGDMNTSASRLLFAQAFNSLGTVLGPFIAGTLLSFFIKLPSEVYLSLDSENKIIAESPYIQYLYLVLFAIMLLIGFVILMVKMPALDLSRFEPLNEVTSMRKRHVLHFSQLRLGAFAIFAYVGAEVSLSAYLYDFSPKSVEYYWMFAMIGRFLGAFFLRNIDVHKAIGYSAGLISLALLFVVFYTGSYQELNYTIVMCVGLLNSILFPTIFTLGVRGLGRYSIDGSSVLIMFIVGGAIVPFNVRNFAYFNYNVALFIVVICYLYISLYGFKFSKFKMREDLPEEKKLI